MTGEYFKSDGSWTNDVLLAWVFCDEREVVNAAYDYDLKDVELVVLMGETPSQYDIVVPLGGAARVPR